MMKGKLVFVIIIFIFLVGCSNNSLNQKIYVEDECEGPVDMSFYLEEGTLIPMTNVANYTPIEENEDGSFDYKVVSTFGDQDTFENIVEVEIICRDTD
ncbi:MAG: hypothetical protein K9L74_06180 [Candidatus Izimaplasma sp.]|nr:hypothetical protein [Candidatus Izimaplasma bacterium]